MGTEISLTRKKDELIGVRSEGMDKPGYVNQRHPQAKAGDLRALFGFMPRTMRFFVPLSLHFE